MGDTLLDEICDALDCHEERANISKLLKDEKSRKVIADSLRNLGANTAIIESLLSYMNEIYSITERLMQDLLTDKLKKREKRIRVTSILIHSAITSTKTVSKLTEKIGTENKDALIVARSVFETALNAAYVTCAGEHTAERAQQHALQKQYRDTDREYLGVHKIILRRDLKTNAAENPYIKDSLNEFTTKKGNEKRDWIDKNVIDRIKEISAIIGKEHVLLFEGALFGVYRHSSEYLHGTFYGPLHFYGTIERDEFPNPFSVRINASSVSIFALAGCVFSILNACETISKHFEYEETFKKTMALIAKISSNEDIIGAGGRT